ncbi:ScyD/ScyE family protein [Nocardioides agariphilus]|uniref:ScyD/ScyE family protein n=1 Tax=Nocardioides agariphilus TaxID=433664 RepID=A0A930VPA7_9ACTN|nr:ScyD/ScyE family protein [Nocardioides agariphilus]MBF4770418.1 ScyD/ScyE family protein [Nocardioides agariphilus]
MSTKSARILAGVAAVALAAPMATSGIAQAAPSTGEAPKILVKDLPGPLSTAVAGDGTAYVTANFAGMLWKVPDGGAPELLYQASEKGAEVGGVSVQGAKVVFTYTGQTHARVMSITGGAAPKVMANTRSYEKQNNPDKKRTYGILGLTASCKAKLPKQFAAFLKPYAGVVDSHPYATEQDGNTTYLADAGGNDILSIANDGTISTVAVLPRVKVRLTKARVKAAGLPACTTGHSYALEAVPTDVELGPDGWLYVSTLTGGPEDGSLGAQSRVYKVNPATGRVVKIAVHLISAVNLAVAGDGDVYVSQLFGGSIIRIPAGTGRKVPFAQVNMPAGLEFTDTGLYATIDALKGTKTPRGKLAFIPFAP